MWKEWRYRDYPIFKKGDQVKSYKDFLHFEGTVANYNEVTSKITLESGKVIHQLDVGCYIPK